MLDTARCSKNNFSSARSAGIQAQPRPDHWGALAAATILGLGFPRFGTTWLAKIFDSHPDVLYRHEPDELTGPDPSLAPAGQIRTWLLQRSPRAAAKRPNFPKSWRPASL